MKIHMIHKCNIIVLDFRIMLSTKKNVKKYSNKSNSILRYIQYVNNNKIKVIAFYGTYNMLTIP